MSSDASSFVPHLPKFTTTARRLAPRAAVSPIGDSSLRAAYSRRCSSSRRPTTQMTPLSPPPPQQPDSEKAEDEDSRRVGTEVETATEAEADIVG